MKPKLWMKLLHRSTFRGLFTTTFKIDYNSFWNNGLSSSLFHSIYFSRLKLIINSQSCLSIPIGIQQRFFITNKAYLTTISTENDTLRFVLENVPDIRSGIEYFFKKQYLLSASCFARSGEIMLNIPQFKECAQIISACHAVALFRSGNNAKAADMLNSLVCNTSSLKKCILESYKFLMLVETDRYMLISNDKELLKSCNFNSKEFALESQLLFSVFNFICYDAMPSNINYNLEIWMELQAKNCYEVFLSIAKLYNFFEMQHKHVWDLNSSIQSERMLDNAKTLINLLGNFLVKFNELLSMGELCYSDLNNTSSPFSLENVVMNDMIDEIHSGIIHMHYGIGTTILLAASSVSHFNSQNSQKSCSDEESSKMQSHFHELFNFGREQVTHALELCKNWSVIGEQSEPKALVSLAFACCIEMQPLSSEGIFRTALEKFESLFDYGLQDGSPLSFTKPKIFASTNEFVEYLLGLIYYAYLLSRWENREGQSIKLLQKADTILHGLSKKLEMEIPIEIFKDVSKNFPRHGKTVVPTKLQMYEILWKPTISLGRIFL